jgi:hypothetical protein
MSIVLGILIILVGLVLLVGGILSLTAGLLYTGILAIVLAIACGVGAFFVLRKKKGPMAGPPPEMPPSEPTPPPAEPTM